MTAILVNWNGWRDTILCLQSLFATADPRLNVIVCDNGSTDDSLANIRMWAEGLLSPWVSPAHPARNVVLSGARPQSFSVTRPHDTSDTFHVGDDLVLIPTGSNLGFGGGNNVGLAAVISRGTSDYVWLLNNDTTVSRESLYRLVAAVEVDQTRVLASSRVMYMEAPDRVWFEGGIFNSLTATARHVSTEKFAASKSGFLSGCALLIGRDAWERIGFLDDARFFMYGEDIDYSFRARAAGIPLRVVRDSAVLHAVSASSKIASPFAYRHNVSSVIRVSRKHFGAWRAVSIIAYHFAKLSALAVVRRPGLDALRAYWQGIRQGFA